MFNFKMADDKCSGNGIAQENEMDKRQKAGLNKSSVLKMFRLRRKRRTAIGTETESGENINNVSNTQEDGTNQSYVVFERVTIDKSPSKKAKRFFGIDCSRENESKFAKIPFNNGNDTSSDSPASVKHKSAPLASPTNSFNDEKDFTSPKEMPSEDCSFQKNQTCSLYQTPVKVRDVSDQKTTPETCKSFLAASLASIGRSLSAIRQSGSRTSIRNRMKSLVSLHTPNNHNGQDDGPPSHEAGSSDQFRTPCKPLDALQPPSMTVSLTRVPHAYYKPVGFRVVKSSSQGRSEATKRRKRRNLTDYNAKSFEARLSEQQQNEAKQRERLEKFKSTVNILKEEQADLFTSGELLYDAVACDISVDGTPVSDFSQKLLEKVGEDIRDDIKRELKFHKVFVTGNGGFAATKYIIFLVDSLDRDAFGKDKIWENMRCAYCELIKKAVEHTEISSVLLPYLFTGEPVRDQSAVAKTALDTIEVFLPKTFDGLKRLDIGGVKDTMGCYESYTRQMDALLSNMTPAKDKFSSKFHVSGENIDHRSNANMDQENCVTSSSEKHDDVNTFDGHLCI